MRRIFALIFILVVLTACSAEQTQAVTDNPATNVPDAGLPNPASVYCEENGNKLEIHTADDGSQTGVCVFPDGSTCDEWDYYQGECVPAAAKTVEATSNSSIATIPPGASEEIADWWGVIMSTEPGAQYDDYFERQDLGDLIYFGIDSLDPLIKSQIEELRDSGKIVHLYGILNTDMPDYNGSQILLDRIYIEE